MSTDHKRRVARLEVAMSPPLGPPPFRAVIDRDAQPGDDPGDDPLGFGWADTVFIFGADADL